ncbi:hypothetical protein ACP4J4_20310 (plasmid) [Aureimonas ureilytica]|uniref:hypothetical protein n=1 Tax=Aureimonas ureilytica TaxID=401562 RepID=UPI003CE6D1D8
MSATSTQSPRAGQRGKNHPERDGFLPLRLAIYRSDIPPDMPSQEGQTREEKAAAQFELTMALNWPFVAESLVGGTLPTYALMPDQSMWYIKKRFWAQSAKELMPETVRCDLPEPVEPHVRVGDIEWLMAAMNPRLMWTADQALMWITTRDMATVKAASPSLGPRRLTWIDFLDSSPFPVMPRIQAMRKLSEAIWLRTLSAWSGRRPFDPKLAIHCKWDWAADDRMAYCALRLAGELQAVTFDSEQVQARYPAEEPASAFGGVEDETVSEEGESLHSSWQTTRPQTTAKGEAECQKWLQAMMNESPSRPIDTKDELAARAMRQFSVSRRGFDRAWGTAIAATGADWNTPGPRPAAKRS